MKNYAKVLGFIFLLLSFYSLPSHTLAEDSISPGLGWQEIPAYGPELRTLADWQGTSADNTTDFGSLLGTSIDNATNDMDNIPGATLTGSSTSGGMGNILSGLMGGSGMGGLGSLFAGLGGMGNMLSGLMGGNGIGGMGNILSGLTGGGGIGIPLGGLTGDGSTGGMGNILGGITGNSGTPSNNSIGSNNTTTGSTTQNNEDLGLVSADVFGTHYDDIRNAPSVIQQLVMIASTLPVDNSAVGLYGPMLPGILSLGITADFDPCNPGRETKWYSPLIIDTDHSGAIALDGGTIPFDIAPHLAGLENIPVPAAGKDMFLVWDKAGTETIEGTTREYKEGEIIDITELFGPEDYSRSDFSKLAYTDDGFTKLAKLCDVNKDGRVDKQDTALSAEVAAKLKLWSPLSGELILFKDTDIVIDVRAGSYERHPSDVEGWAVEYKMKDAQDNLVGYEWLTSKTSSLLCVDVLLAVQGK